MSAVRDRVNDLGQPIGEDVDGWAPPPFPPAVTLAGRYCTLEPLAVSHARDLYEELHRDGSGAQWTYMAYGPFTDGEAFGSFVEAVVADRSTVTYALTDPAGRAQGMASYLRVKPAIGSIEVGSVIFGSALQRTAGATEAMYLMARNAFDDLGYRRYEWKCDSLNAPSRAAERLGFSFEGVWRNATIYKGRNRDTAWYAMTADDWRRVRPQIEAWLDPSNFEDGRQRTKLSTSTLR